MVPLGMSLRTFQILQREKVFSLKIVRVALDQILLGLNFLHEADVVHTGTCLDILE
jgi:serine/threonine-protein kinase SRPK3